MNDSVDGLQLADHVEEDMIVFASVYGFIRFDAAKVAAKLREGQLSRIEAHGLANLIEGKHPKGLKLAMRGQGKGWKPALEGYVALLRAKRVNDFVAERLQNNCTTEEAVIDAAEAFKISEPTVYRDLAIGRKIDLGEF